MQQQIELIEDFNEFMRRDALTPNEHMLIQAIALITVAEGYTHMTPEEVWEILREQTLEIVNER